MKVVYAILQCTWGIFQTVLGLFIFIIHIKNKHFYYHGAIVTEWQNKSSVSLGLFVFVTKEPFFAEKFIEAGANRLGTSRIVKIVKSLNN